MPSSKLFPIIMGIFFGGISLDGTRGRKPSGPSMFGKKEISDVPELGGTTASRPCRIELVSTDRRQPIVSFVFERAAH